MDKSKVTIETYNKSAEKYQEKFMNMDLYNDTFDMLCELISINGEVLELACGPGNVTKYLLKKRPDLKLLGLDLAPKMIELAKANNPKVEFIVKDCRDISNLEKKYDTIVCGFLMPYLSKEECEKLILDSSELLKTDGLIYLSTMEDQYDKSGFETTSFSGEDQVYIYYHQANFLRETLEKNNFEILSLQRKDYPEPDGTFLTDIIFLAKKT